MTTKGLYRVITVPELLAVGTTSIWINNSSAHYAIWNLANIHVAYPDTTVGAERRTTHGIPVLWQACLCTHNVSRWQSAMATRRNEMRNIMETGNTLGLEMMDNGDILLHSPLFPCACVCVCVCHLVVQWHIAPPPTPPPVLGVPQKTKYRRQPARCIQNAYTNGHQLSSVYYHILDFDSPRRGQEFCVYDDAIWIQSDRIPTRCNQFVLCKLLCWGTVFVLARQLPLFKSSFIPDYGQENEVRIYSLSSLTVLTSLY